MLRPPVCNCIIVKWILVGEHGGRVLGWGEVLCNERAEVCPVLIRDPEAVHLLSEGVLGPLAALWRRRPVLLHYCVFNIVLR